MFVPVKWLEDYIDLKGLDIRTLEDRLIMSGSNTETVKRVAEGAEKVVVGRLDKVEKHPNADKLSICQVNVGATVEQIVTGAANIKEGDIVPVALEGTRLPDGRTIGRTNFRGVESNGMLISLDELGFEDKVIPKALADGIWILDDSFKPGDDLLAVSELQDHVIEFEITPNRADCLSIIGMARETAATFERPVRYPEITVKGSAEQAEDFASVEVQDEALCPRYSARIVKDVRIGDSPVWMQLRLMKAGMRPINNIVDITNYVLLEMGQPIHAFDLDTLKGHKIIVRRAKPEETLVTLDGVERKLDENMLLIADSERGVAIAGVMGGDETEVKPHTTRLLIEVANFNKTNIRETSRKLGLRSEASSRYEKGVDPNLAALASDRVCQLIEQLGAGTVVGGIIDHYPVVAEPLKIAVRTQRVNQMLGTAFTTQEVEALLGRLSLTAEREGETLLVTAPTYRPDLTREIDFVEEVARLYGYDRIPTTLPRGNGWGAKTNGQHREDVSKELLLGCGLSEITTYSFVSPRSLDLVRIPDYSYLRSTVNLMNPLGEEYSIMRTTLLPNMLEVLARNAKRNVPQAAFFEIGNLFFPKQLPVTELPIEKKALCIGCYGGAADFFTLKGIVCKYLDRMGIRGYRFVTEANNETFHPGRCAAVIMGNHVIGTLGEVHPTVLENYELRERAYLADLDFNILVQAARMDNVYRPLPKFPAITRDLAVLVADEITAGELVEIVQMEGGPLLAETAIFDVYKGKQIPDGMKSVAIGMTFRAPDRTLTDEEIGGLFSGIVQKLEELTGATLRS